MAETVCSKGNTGTVAAAVGYQPCRLPPSGTPQTRPQHYPALGPFFFGGPPN
jgi:hypothetical protein